MPTPLLLPLARTLMRQRYRSLPQRALSVPRADDEAHGSGAALAGHRILVVGNSYAISWGVRIHTLGLPGQLARELSRRTDRGAEVDVVSDPSMSITGLLDAAGDRDYSSYDAVIVITGVGDAYRLVPPLRWMLLMKQLLQVLTAATTSVTQVTVVGIQSVSSVPVCHAKKHGVADRWAEALNEVTEALCSSMVGVHYLRPPVASEGDLDQTDLIRFKSPALYRVWAAALARHLVPTLPEPAARQRPAAVAVPTKTARNAVVVSTFPGPTLDARFMGAVRRAQSLFGTQGAAFNLINGGYVTTQAGVGFESTTVPAEQSFCAATVQTPGAFVVEDAWSDPRISFDTAVRFYAGYPVTTTDGTTIGALCVFDTKARKLSAKDAQLLEELSNDIATEYSNMSSGNGYAEADMNT